MKRRLATFAAGASLVLCIATVALWVRSYWFQQSIGCQDAAQTSYHVDFLSGRAMLQLQYSAYYPTESNSFFYRARRATQNSTEALPSDTIWNRIGFWYRAEDKLSWGGNVSRPHPPISPPRWFRWFGLPQDKRVVNRFLTVPMWVPTLLTAILPASFLRDMRRRARRMREGHCIRCGYDLRATPERCPECGTESALATDGAPIHTDHSI